MIFFISVTLSILCSQSLMHHFGKHAIILSPGSRHVGGRCNLDYVEMCNSEWMESSGQLEVL